MAKQKDNVKKGFAGLKKKRAEQPTNSTPVQEVKQQPVVKPVAKAGRKSHKDPNVKYTKMGAWIKEETMMRMKMALLTTCKEKHKTQEDLTDAAINFYLDHLNAQ